MNIINELKKLFGVTSDNDLDLLNAAVSVKKENICLKAENAGLNLLADRYATANRRLESIYDEVHDDD